MLFKKRPTSAAAILAVAVALTGCSVTTQGAASYDGKDSDPPSSEAAPSSTPDSTSEPGSGSGGTTAADWDACDMHAGVEAVSDLSQVGDDEITIGAFAGWEDSIATAYLYAGMLNSQGAEVDVVELDPAAGFPALAGGELDLVTSVWMPTTHAEDIAKYGDQVDSLGCWYDNAKLTIAVNESSPAKSIGDLAQLAGDYNNELIGAEPSSALTDAAAKAIQAYGLQGLAFAPSSMDAMLGEVKAATDGGVNIAATMYRPHWAYDAYSMRDLEDPQGAMGGAESLYAAASLDFADEHPAAAQLAKNLVMSDEVISSLMNAMFGDESAGDEEGAAMKWISENVDFVDDWASGEL